jgi:hypothetical protein
MYDKPSTTTHGFFARLTRQKLLFYRNQSTTIISLRKTNENTKKHKNTRHHQVCVDEQFVQIEIICLGSKKQLIRKGK